MPEKSLEQTAADAIKVLNQAADTAADRLAKAADGAVGKLAQAADNAIKVVASAAAEAQKVSSARVADDHDLLIRISEKVDGLKGDVRDLKDGTSIKIADHEKRIGCLEIAQSATVSKSGGMRDMWGWIVSGILALIVVAEFFIRRTP